MCRRGRDFDQGVEDAVAGLAAGAAGVANLARSHRHLKTMNQALSATIGRSPGGFSNRDVRPLLHAPPRARRGVIAPRHG
jgi:hypothetical protein